MSTNKLGFICSLTEDEPSLNASVRHSLATSRPSRSTPEAGSTVHEETHHHQKEIPKGKIKVLHGKEILPIVQLLAIN